MNNILVSAIGSMSSEAVIASLRRTENAKVIGCDIYDKEWIYPSKLVDVFYQVSRADSSGYINDILDICKKEKINYIFPLTDIEIDLLSDFIEIFKKHGIIICIAPVNVIKKCRNKSDFYKYLSNVEDLSLLPTFEYEDIGDIAKNISIVAKPKLGRSSEGLFVLNDRKKIDLLIDDKQKYIFQPFINGTVVTVDIVRDDFGNNFFVSREELIRTKNGAGITVRLLKDERIARAVAALTAQMDFRGCFNVEFLFDGQCYYLMDINPRFSAGIAFSQSIGYDFVYNHLRVFVGKEINLPVNYIERILCKRYIEYF